MDLFLKVKAGSAFGYCARRIGFVVLGADLGNDAEEALIRKVVTAPCAEVGVDVLETGQCFEERGREFVCLVLKRSNWNKKKKKK